MGATPPLARQERLVEWTIDSAKIYGDPFNDVDVDVIFSKDGQSWRVPTFWRGGSTGLCVLLHRPRANTLIACKARILGIRISMDMRGR